MSIDHLNVETGDVLASFLELAANNDVEGFKRSVDQEPSSVNKVGLWYGRQKGSKQMVLQQRTPLMVAATYGNIEVLKLVISLPEVDVNLSCGLDNSTALHCAASGGSANAIDAAKLLLEAGADRSLTDANGCLALDVIKVAPKFDDMKITLESILLTDDSFRERNLGVSPALEKKEYPVDPSLPDIKTGIYSSDEFRMFSFKIRPCSRAYSHDWTECPFVHPGENARRRDPRKYHYSCVPCPDFRKGACQRGDMCQYAHGVFESWLHPAQYRTRICKDGMDCDRRVCFFAHTQEEIRPLYLSTGSAIPAHHANAMDFAAAMSLFPGSPSSASAISPSPFTPPMSPSSNGNSNMGWAHQNVPTLHLPGSNLQSNRLRSSLSLLSDIGAQQHQQLNERALIRTNPLNRSARSITLAPTNPENSLITESASPRYSDQSQILNPFQQQTTLSPIKMNFSPRNVDHSLLQASLSPRRMEPMSPMRSRASTLAQREMLLKQYRSLSSNDPDAVIAPESTFPNWGFSTTFPRSSSFDLTSNGEDPDLLWIQSFVKDTPQDMNEVLTPLAGSVNAGTSSGNGANANSEIEQIDQSILGAWLEHMRLDHLMAQ